MKTRAWVNAALASLMLAAGGAWSQQSDSPPLRKPPESLSVPSHGSGVSDTVLTARAKIALLGAAHVDSNDVHVATQGGVVRLTGHVASAEQKQKAGAVVQGLDGIRAVQNELTVGATGH